MSNIQTLNNSPQLASIIGDYHIRAPIPSDNATPVDTGIALTEAYAMRDIDGDIAPLNNQWDIGADEFNPNNTPLISLRSRQITYDGSKQSNPPITIEFFGAKIGHYNTTEGDMIAIFKVLSESKEPVANIEIIRNAAHVTIYTPYNEPNTNGKVTFDYHNIPFTEGAYVAKLVSKDNPDTVKAQSNTFFLYGLH